MKSNASFNWKIVLFEIISDTKNNYRGDIYTLLSTVLTFGFSQKLLNVFGQIKTKNWLILEFAILELQNHF